MKNDWMRGKGQALVEFALVIPIFLVLLLGMVEFGRAWMTKNIITGAAREAVRRYAVLPYDNSVTGEAYLRAVDILSSAGLNSSRWTISLTVVNPATDNNIMRADVTYNFDVKIIGFIPGLPTDNVLMASSSTMRKE